ncbi:glutamine--fructose-6-phosphate transaminase (isomerizing) [Thermomicrobiaceae bacterium CFH 74404]|uniref:Glutamine--fructose-6-phosphate aminotransferase [isomerizing] n=1 Tax=Thermalbibacter longus TaxID=2951981 RepID=A0AA41WIM4_9BACT|nr:glutamine--fructose-6-phosphate transaminase (isomerizing) [Thermalbibacter longus]MCM8750051.1 glutamine--fructose-6-phosphate transaminase (isomerizing) [Thermalbibacter longus]
MCGIFGYVTTRAVCAGTVVDALRKLEYRGYDSWGVGIGINGHISVVKRAGRIPATTPDLPASSIAFGHTRWATHGGVTDVNAHPHLDCTGQLAVIHNGIIENFRKLRCELEADGHRFRSDTDSEVFAHLVEQILAASEAQDPETVVRAVQAAFERIEGLNAFIVLHYPTQQLIAVKSISPLVIGIGSTGTYVASDAVALVGLAEQVHYLGDDEVAAIRADGLHLYDRSRRAAREPRWQALALKSADTSLDGFPHYLIKEIHEQPRVLERIIREHPAQARELAELISRSYGTFLVGCGTAGYAALAGSYLFSRIARRHVNSVVASEFKYQEHFLTERSLVIALSQSGETVDVIEAVLAAKRRGARVAALVNVTGSTLDRLADFTLPLLAGPEQSVLSTKAYTAKLALLLLTAHILNGSEHVGLDLLWRAVDGMVRALTPDFQDRVKAVADRLADHQHCFVIGRGLSYPTALEAALKIKEVSYLHAEGFPGGELKHGVIALVEPGVPCFVFSPLDETRADILSGAMELQSRGGWIIGVSPEDEAVFDVHLPVAEVGDASPLVNVIPAQLLGYYLAVRKGLDPDKPRNLAKSVTVK